MKILKVKHYRQTPSFCGPASLKILFSHFGKHYTEKQFIKLTGATAKYGTEHEDLVRAAKKLGAHVYTKKGATISDLENWVIKNQTPVIVGWFSEDEDHYSVVIGLTKNQVLMADPQRKSPISKIDRQIFPKIWFDFTGKGNSKICWGWMMGIK